MKHKIILIYNIKKILIFSKNFILMKLISKIDQDKIKITNINEIGNVSLETSKVGNVFVYGSYVDDFLSIKKDKIFTILFGVVKKLIERVEHLEMN